MEDFDIDLVYLWCDGNDAAFAQQKRERMILCGGHPEGALDCRFVQIDELKYSLRSVNMYMPWIRRIFIVTNNQTPKWLKQHEKITIVDHSEILPDTARPCFNSEAIECCLHKIPNLAEHFIYANDDCFVGRKISPSFFFDKKKRSIVRMTKTKSKPLNTLHWKNMLASQKAIFQRYGVSYEGYIPHHNMDAYTKTMLQECEQEFSDFMRHTIHQPFRSEGSLQRLLFHLYGFVQKQAVLKNVNKTFIQKVLKRLRIARWDSLFISNQDDLGIVNACHPALFCLNDGECSTDEDRVRAVRFLEKKFPQKSPFEKDA